MSGMRDQEVDRFSSLRSVFGPELSATTICHTERLREPYPSSGRQFNFDFTKLRRGGTFCPKNLPIDLDRLCGTA